MNMNEVQEQMSSVIKNADRYLRLRSLALLTRNTDLKHSDFLIAIERAIDEAIGGHNSTITEADFDRLVDQIISCYTKYQEDVAFKDSLKAATSAKK